MNFGAIIWYYMNVGLVFAFLGANVFETNECFGHVSRHGEVDFAVGVVPIEGNANVFVPVLVNFNLVGFA